MKHKEDCCTTAIQVSFDPKKPPRELLRRVFPELSDAELQEIVDEQVDVTGGSGDITIKATCECFTVCEPIIIDAPHEPPIQFCHEECYICWPGPAAKCFGPYPTGCR